MKKNAVPTAQKLNKLVRRASGLMALEQRFMFDGAAVADAVDAHLDSVIPVKVGVTSEAVTKALDLVPPALTTNSTPARVELVFIESDVGNYQSLLNGLSPDVEVHVLDAAQDGLAQIAQALAGRSGIDAIHIVSHGAEGSLQLGASSLTAQNLASHAADLAAVGRALDANADILLYGCSVAAGSDGAAFVSALAAATQADIAASTNATGSAARGGDWVLEQRQGDISTDVAFDLTAMQAYDGLLATNFGFDSITSGDNSNSIEQIVGSDTLVLTSTVDPMYLVPSSGENNSSGLVVLAGGDTSETKVRIALSGGKLFDLSAFTLVALGANDANKLKITTNTGASQTFSAALFDGTGSYLVNTSFTGISFADITSTASSFNWAFDNFVLNNIITPDTTPPTVTVAVADNALKVGETSLVTFMFSEAVLGFDNSDLTIANGTLSVVSTSDGGLTWTATLTPTFGIEDASNLITIDNTGVSDAAGNAGLGSTNSNNYAIDTVMPTVNNITSSTPNGTYKPGASISVQVNFSEAVIVTGTPQLTLETGSTDRVVNYASGSGTSTLTFNYTVQAGDTSADLDYISTSALALNGGTIKDAAGNDATRTLASPGAANSLGSNKALVLDSTAPAITSVFVPANSTYVAGSNLDFTVNFSEAVSVNTGGGTPYMSVTLDTGGVVQAAYLSGSGSSALQFRYTVASANVDANGISIGSSITNNGGTIKDAAGNDSALTLNSVASTSGVLVEAVPPAFASAATNASGTKVILTYNDTLNATTAAAGNFTVMVGSSARTVSSAVVSGSTVELTLALAIGGGEVVTVAYADPTAGNDANAIQDALGNDAVSLSASTVTNNAAAQYYASFGQIFTANNPNGNNFSTFVAVNTTDGLGIRVYPVDPSSPTYNPATNFVSNGSTNTVFLVVNGAVTQLYLTNGAEKLGGASTPEDAWVICNTTLLGVATTRYVLSSGGYSIDTTGESINSSISLADLDQLVTVQVASRPSITIGTIAGNDVINASEASSVVAISGTTTNVENGRTVTVTVDGQNYTTTVSSNAWTLNVPVLDVASFEASEVVTADVSDLAGTAATQATRSITLDTTRPSATIVVADNALTIGETSLVTITFSEAATGFTNADLTIANGTLTNVTSGDGGITWTATFTPTAGIEDTTNLITLNNALVTDSSGNAGTGNTDSNNYAIDTIRPTATIVVADNALIVGETSLVTITFSEVVTGFTNADLTIANGTLTNVSSGDGGITWTATFTPTAGIEDTTNLITIDKTGVSDGAGNAGTGTTNSNNYAIDTVLPTATIVVADSALKIGETSLVTITFSEVVTGFTNADLTIANGTLTNVSSGDGGITWTATFTPTAGIEDTTNLITIDKAGVSDGAGNAGTGTTDSNNYAIDTVRPTATIVVADSALKIGDTSLVTITFSEVVTGFTNADLTIANGTLSNVSSGDGGITWTATFTPTAGIEDTTNLITIDKTGVSDGAGNAGTGTTNSNNYAIDTFRPAISLASNKSSLVNGEAAEVTFTLSEAATDFLEADVAVTGGALSAWTAVSSTVYTATFTGAGVAGSISVADTQFNDAAGNANADGADADNTVTMTVDTVIVSITNVTVNEASPSAVFTVTGVEGQQLALSLVNTATTGLTAIEYFDGTNWVTPGANVTLPTVGGALNDETSTLLVRVAISPEQETSLDGPELFKLVATNTGGTASTGGVGTIKDDGTGTIFKDDGTDDTTAVPDDDRVLSVNNISVNEASPYGAFEVTGEADQLTSLALALGTSNPATATGTDYGETSGSGLSYSTDGGTSWNVYTGGNVALDTSGKLLVRTAIINDSTNDNNETFKLTATNTGGLEGSGEAEIKDDGTGTVFKDDGTDDTTVVRDDDRSITVTGGSYNENSPRALFTVNANPGQVLTLDVQNDAEPGKAPTGDNEGKPSDSLVTAPIYYSLNGGAIWQLYTGPVTAGAVPVLVAIDITNERDDFYEGEEQLKLVVTSGGQAASGFSSIFDDGTGTVTKPITDLTTNDTGANDPAVAKDDDRPKPAPVVLPPEAPAPKAAAPLALPPEPSAPAQQAFSSEVQPLAPRLVPVEAPVPIGDVLTSSSGFRVAVNETASPGLALNRGITDQFVEGNGSSAKLSLPYDAFIHSDKDAVIKLEAKQADNSPLPAWVRFDPATGSFEVNPPKEFKGKLDLKVTAMDDDSRQAVAIFQLFVGDKPAEQKPQSRNSLTEKLRLAGQRPITLIKLGGEVTKPAPAQEVSVRAAEVHKATAG